MICTKSTRMIITTIGLIFLCGPGCSSDDKSAQQQAAALRAALDAKQKELDCKVAAMSIVCNAGDTTCTTNKANALQACNALACPGGANGSGAFGVTCVDASSNTNTNTSTSTTTTTN